MIAPPWRISRCAIVGIAREAPVTERRCSRNSGSPASRRTSRPASISTVVLPCKPCRAGKQPVAMLAETTRVAEGNTERWAAKHVASAAKAARQGMCSGVTLSRRTPSRMTTTARGMAMLPS